MVQRRKRKRQEMKKLVRKILKMYTDEDPAIIQRNLKWVLSYSARYKKEITVYIVIGIISIWMSLASAVASKKLVDAVSSYNLSGVLPAVVGMILLASLSILFQCAASRVSIKMNIRMKNEIQQDVYQKILRVKWLELSRFHSGDLLNRFHSDTAIVAESVSGLIPGAVIKVISFLSSFAVIIYYDYTMAIIALLSAPILILASKFMMKKMHEHNKKMKEIGSETTSFGIETFRNMEAVKSFHLTKRFEEKLLKLQDKYKSECITYNLFSTRMTMCLSFVGLGVNYACFGWGAFRLFQRRITYGTLTLFLQQASSLQSNFQGIVNILPSTISTVTSAGRILEIISLEKEEQGNAVIPKSIDRIEITNASFQYQEGKEVLKHINFRAEKGQIVCLVGPSGEGKTTMLRMLLGLISPKTGRAVVGNETEEVLISQDTRKYYAYVPQENTLFSGTVAENLRLAAPNASDEELREALEIACALDFVETLPQGINTQVIEKNSGLSMGQCQRLMIARAVLSEAPVLLLDEATSALDMVTERKIIRNVVAAKQEKICIVTTHRPNVLYMADTVYRVNKGELSLLNQEQIEAYINEF